jgi:transcriptional regulator with XRE-family HTH domain
MGLECSSHKLEVAVGRRIRGQIDEFTTKLIQRAWKLMSERGWDIAELARRMGLHRTNMSRYLRVGESGYGSWTVGFIQRIAAAFGLTMTHFMGDLWDTHTLNVSAVVKTADQEIWNPAGSAAQKALQIFSDHEVKATEGIGFFRIPPCTILLPQMSEHVGRNLFGHFGTYGEKIISAYMEIERVYRQQYISCGGSYGSFRVMTLIFDSDIQRLIRGEGEFFGCHNAAAEWLEKLENTHVRRLDYKIGFVDDDKIPTEIRYDFLNADSLVIVGTTLSARRVLGTYQIQFCMEGERLILDQRYLRTLANTYADFSRSGIIRKIETFKKQADEFARKTPKRR